MSGFTAHHTHSLFAKTIPQDNLIYIQEDRKELPHENALQSLLKSLKPPIEKSRLRSALLSIKDYEEQFHSESAQNNDIFILKQTIISRLLVGFYAETLDVCLQEAVEADAEAQWWGDIERSWRRLVWYSLQSP